jgi:hypothetical protein
MSPYLNARALHLEKKTPSSSLYLMQPVLVSLCAFTLGSRDSSVESPNTISNHLKLKPSYHENLMLS